MLIVANWKANIDTVEKAKRLYAGAKRLALTSKHELVLAPSAPHLGVLAPANRSKVAFAAQDISSTLGGSETGEITAAVVAGVKGTYVIIGHSERRARGESDEVVLQKVRHALAHGLTPILCIGERERDTEATYLSVLRNQLHAIFSALSAKERAGVVLAYEPVWAIGKSASEGITPTDLNEMILYIRKLLGEYLPGKSASKVRILYGGAVEATNARMLAATASVDGFLVGHASTDVTTFSSLVKALA